MAFFNLTQVGEQDTWKRQVKDDRATVQNIKFDVKSYHTSARQMADQHIKHTRAEQAPADLYVQPMAAAQAVGFQVTGQEKALRGRVGGSTASIGEGDSNLLCNYRYSTMSSHNHTVRLKDGMF